MKKWIIRLAVVAVLLGAAAIIGLSLYLDQIVKKGVETVGPMITKTEVKLDKASLSPLSGSATLHGLVVGNPEGYARTDAAIKAGKISITLKPMSVLSDKVEVDSLVVEEPEITLEGGIRDNNLFKILDNLNAAAASAGGSAESGGSSQKIVVADVLVRGAKVRVNSLLTGGQTVTVPLPDVHLTNLGTGNGGLLPAELSREVIEAVLKQVTKTLPEALAKLGKVGVDSVKKVGETGKDTVEKTAGGLKKLFKK